MDLLFAAIIALDLLIIALFTIVIVANKTFNKIQIYYLLHTIFLIGLICVSEFFSAFFNNSDLQYMWIHRLTNLFVFGATPLVFYLLGKSIFPQKKMLFFIYVWIAYCIWLGITQYTGNSVFIIDENNHFSRDKGFIIYLGICWTEILFFFIENARLALKYQHKNNLILLLIILLLVFGFVIQLTLPNVYITWLSILVSVILYYIFFDEFRQQLDKQTNLLNYYSFLRVSARLLTNVTLVVIEIDDLKKLQLKYSRDKVDEMVVEIADNFKEYYKKYGDCFRLGTEEFVVIIYDSFFENNIMDLEKINQQFFKEHVRNYYNTKEIPLISIGYSQLKHGQNIDDALSQADQKKKEFVLERMNYLY